MPPHKASVCSRWQGFVVCAFTREARLAIFLTRLLGQNKHSQTHPPQKKHQTQDLWYASNANVICAAQMEIHFATDLYILTSMFMEWKLEVGRVRRWYHCKLFSETTLNNCHISAKAMMHSNVEVTLQHDIYQQHRKSFLWYHMPPQCAHPSVNNHTICCFFLCLFVFVFFFDIFRKKPGKTWRTPSLKSRRSTTLLTTQEVLFRHLALQCVHPSVNNHTTLDTEGVLIPQRTNIGTKNPALRYFLFQQIKLQRSKEKLLPHLARPENTGTVF